MKKKIEIKFVCKQCGADVQENLIDKKKSNSNWKVSLENCPFCGGKIGLSLINDSTSQ